MPSSTRSSSLKSSLSSSASSKLSSASSLSNPPSESSHSSNVSKRSAEDAFGNAQSSTANNEVAELLHVPRKKARLRATSFPVTLTESRGARERQRAILFAKKKKKLDLAKVARLGWTGMPAPAQRGMDNFTGSLCYRLSVLQALLHQPAFVHWVQANHAPLSCLHDNSSKCVTCLMYRLITTYWFQRKDDDLDIIIRQMDTVFRKLGWRTDVDSEQADPDEHINWILKTMAGELPAESAASLDALFAVSTSSVVTCKKCRYQSVTNGHADRSLSVPIAPRQRDKGLEAYLDKFMCETVEGYKCGRCGEKSNAARTQDISNGPAVLAVSLKRYDCFGRKITYDVPFTANLDLSKYASGQEELKYRLSAVIKHHGGTGGGHYVCHAEGPAGWNLYNDRSKSGSSVGRACESGGFTPYVLYYKRV